MKKLKCLAVDDEPPAIRLLEKFVEKVSFLEMAATTNNSLEALQLINSGKFDLVLMDIQMPDLTGIQLSRIVKGEVAVIFTTAYPQFALESYDLNAVDYLLKPFEFERFYEAVLKVDKSKTILSGAEPAEDFLFVKTDGKNNFEKIRIAEIQLIKGLKNYVTIYLPDRQVITYSTLKYMEDSLMSRGFIKTHKSYIVALRHIQKTDSLSVYVGEQSVPIGDTYRQHFFNVINQRKL